MDLNCLIACFFFLESELVGNINQSLGSGRQEGFGGGAASPHNTLASSTLTTANSSGLMGSSGLAGASTSGGGGVGLKVNSENGSECSSVTSESLPAGYFTIVVVVLL